MRTGRSHSFLSLSSFTTPSALVVLCTGGRSLVCALLLLLQLLLLLLLFLFLVAHLLFTLQCSRVSSASLQ